MTLSPQFVLRASVGGCEPKWPLGAPLAAVYFAYSATIEERNLTKQFPDTYPVYRRSTKMLVPFIF